MEQLISVLMALLMAFMQLISTFMGGFGGDTKKLEFTWPVPSESKIQTDYEEGKHDGIDIVLTKGETDGSQVLSAEEGTVAAVVKGDAKLGNYFIIDHKTVQTIYANCGEINVANGTPVIKGQILATIGKSAPGGNAYLHFA
ncbi:MAG: M23 family metallopeptidase, partial [Clostridia bacterium]|nr:M23 family metallopeptidase [Clostridia bacterium]